MNVLKQSAEALENRLLKTGRVLATRSWSPAGFVEVDLHLPGCDMSGWTETKHIKCRVAPFTYRDYTPAGWDAETQTCTLYIETGHDGPGSHWARRLKRGDCISYLGVANSHQRAESDRQLVFLGDETAIGHFFALSGLAGPGAPITGALSILHQDHQQQFAEYFPRLHLQLLKKREAQDYESLLRWVNDTIPSGQNAVFLLAGYGSAVSQMRRLLRQKGYGNDRVRAEGFWN
ncbi:MAG: SIP domain-containing protein [Puia sp.]|nr:SIP domain-containing protein [Puia sp.]